MENNGVMRMPTTNTITNRQLFLALFIAVTTYDGLTLPYIMARTAGRGAWITIIIATLIFSASAVIVTKLQIMNRGKMIFDYCSDIGGRVFAFIVSVIFVLYYISVLAYLNSQIFGLIKTEFLIRTPNWAILLAGILLFGYIAYKGITNVARLVEVVAPLFIFFAIVVLVVMLVQGNISNILPLFEPDHIADYALSLKNLVMPFMGMSVLLVVPFTPRNKKATKWALLGVLFIGIFYVLVVEGSFSIAGINTLMHYKTGVIEAIRLVNFPVIERVDIMFLTIGFAGLFVGAIMVYISMTEHLCKMFPKCRRSIIVLIQGAVIFFINIFFTGIREENDAISTIITVWVLIMAFVIPGLLLILSKVKQGAQKND